tara:strand:- start:21 stop:1178 length:1158 start_codon:yes stop_codon:yes gene_type:complete
MDRLHNMKTLEHVPKEKQKRIALETLEIYVPIADRLGMGRIKRELEDLAFPYVYTKEFEEINLLFKKKNKETLQRLDKMHKALKRVLGEHDIRNFKTEHRIKGLYSLYQKLERKDWDLEKIHDILAIRIVVPTVADCYTVFGTIHSVWKPLPGKIKDYIAFPKPNGYQSLHTTVFTKEGGIVEIQIRTEEMHRRAQFGIASHLAYKESGGRKRPQQYIKFANEWLQQLLPSILRFNTKNNTKQKSAKKEDPQSKSMQVPTWIRDIAESHQAEAGEEFLDNLKSDFFSHRVFVFTPKGDVIDLPISSSTIDFAYTIHSDIGNHTFGAKVNGKLVSLDTELHNGDIVEILTRPSSHPTNRWLEFAKTTAARKHIRIALDAQQKLNTR